MPEGNPIKPAINPYADIPIPDDVYVEEQYADILEIVNYILPLLEEYEYDNSTSEGRLRGELMWVKQEVKAKRFPIPGTTSMVATTEYLGNNYYLPADMPNVKLKLQELSSIVECDGLVKPRHYPRVIEFVDKTIAKAESVLETDKELTLAETKNMKGLISELKKIGHLLYRKDITFPLNESDWPAY